MEIPDFLFMDQPAPNPPIRTTSKEEKSDPPFPTDNTPPPSPLSTDLNQSFNEYDSYALQNEEETISEQKR